MDFRIIVKKKTNSSFERGFSLVEVLVTLGLLGVVAIGVSALLSQMNTQVIQAGNRTDRQGLQTQLEAVLRSPVSCLNNLASISLGSTPALSLTNIKQ